MAKVPVTIVDNSQKSLDKGLSFAGAFKCCIDHHFSTVTKN